MKINEKEAEDGRPRLAIERSIVTLCRPRRCGRGASRGGQTRPVRTDLPPTRRSSGSWRRPRTLRRRRSPSRRCRNWSKKSQLMRLTRSRQSTRSTQSSWSMQSAWSTQSSWSMQSTWSTQSSWSMQSTRSTQSSCSMQSTWSTQSSCSMQSTWSTQSSLSIHRYNYIIIPT